MKFKKLIKNKKFQISALVICILTVAFFWGGNNEVVPLDSSETSIDENRFSGEVLEEEETDEYKEDESEDDEDDKEKDKEEQKKEENKKSEDKDKKEQKQKKQDQVKEEQRIVKQQEEKKQEIVKEQKSEKEQIIAQDDKNSGKKDKYKTDEIPKGKPKPKEWQEAQIDKEKKMTATLSISAKSILNNMDMFNKDKMEVLPKDGIVYQAQKVEFFEGESVFDVLLRETKKNKIHMEFNMTPIYNSNYIEGINNLYEFDCGELSGWMYKVNGWFPNYGASRYELKDGDNIVWEYTCDLGRDIGGEKSAGGN